MKFDQLVLAVIVVGILITGSVVAVIVYNNAQNSRIAYISVKTDRSFYDAGENVTFKLFDNTPDIDFNVTDPGNDPQRIVQSMGEINIIKIPDFVDPDWVVTHPLSRNDDLSIPKPFRIDAYVATIHYDYFNSKQSALNLSWDGMIVAPNEFTGDVSYFPANTGYYVIMPDFLYASSHKIQFNIDRGAIFHYNGLNAGINITNNPSHNVTVNLSLRAPPGTTGNLTCQLYSNFQYTEFPTENITETTVFPRSHYHNESMVLTSESDIIRTMLFDAKVPDHGVSAGGASFFQLAYFDALLVTPIGNFTFGFNGIWDGGWRDVQQY
jgi:hypothetical protein